MGLAVGLFGTLALGFNGVRGRLKPVDYLGRWGGGLAPLKSLLQTTAGNVEMRRDPSAGRLGLVEVSSEVLGRWIGCRQCKESLGPYPKLLNDCLLYTSPSPRD